MVNVIFVPLAKRALSDVLESMSSKKLFVRSWSNLSACIMAITLAYTI